MAASKKKKKKKKKKGVRFFALTIARDSKGLKPMFVLMLGRGGKVWITAFGVKIARLKGCKHKNGHPRPTKETSLDLSGLGDKLGLKLGRKNYTAHTANGRSGFLLPTSGPPKVVGAGDWEATEGGDLPIELKAKKGS